MVAPKSSADIANLTCDHLGLDPINSIDQPYTNTERTLARHYDESRRSLLRESSWNFAKCRATVNRNGTPDFDYSDSYAMPTDFIRLLSINEFNIIDTSAIDTPGGTLDSPQLLWYQQYDFSQNSLLISAGGAPTLQVRYIQDVTDVTLWSTEFGNLVALDMAVKTCVTLTNDRQLYKIKAEEFLAYKTMALGIDGQEAKPRRVQRSRALEARRGANSYGISILGGTYFYFGP